RDARAATAQRRLVAAAVQQERKARAAAAQRRLVAYWTRCLKLQYEYALAAPLSPRLATLITQLETQDVSASADRGSSVPGGARLEGRRAAAVNGRAMSALIPLRLIYLRCGERRFVPLPDSRTAAKMLSIRSPRRRGRAASAARRGRASCRF